MNLKAYIESSEVVIILKRCKISFGLPFSDIFAMGGRREAAAQCSYYFVKSVFLLQLGNLWTSDQFKWEDEADYLGLPC